MSLITLFAIATGLAMDAFAVSIAVGLALKRVTGRQAFRLSFHFGLFQFLMPIIGWLAGLTVERWIASFDHWIVLGLLAFIGIKMIRGSFQKDEHHADVADPTRGASLVMLSLATSIDALAVGLSLALLKVKIWYPAVVIGIVAGLLTLIGMRLGQRLGSVFGKRMEAIGGLILLFIGCKIVWEHLSG